MRKCGDQMISGRGRECEADGNQRMSGVDGKEHRRVGYQTDTIYLGRSAICKQGKVNCKQSFVEQGASEGCKGLGICDHTQNVDRYALF